MIGYPLDSHVSYKPDGTPVWDRAISSAPYRKLIKSLFSDGVLPNPSTNLQVIAGTGMQVKIFKGFALCNGCQKLQEVDMVLNIAQSSVVYDRIDTVVLRLNDNDDVRECEFYVISGKPAQSPNRAELTQTDSIWEIGLADILVKANSTQISNANITDTRYDSARCGIISSISQFDTTTLYQQIQTDLAEFKNVNEAEIVAWFESIKGMLDGDIGAKLQNQVEHRVSSEHIGKSFGNLIEFVETTAATIDHGHMFRFKDTSGWGPAGTADTWYQCIVQYQNAYGNESADIEGNVTIFEGQKTWTGLIAGNKKTGISVSWRRVIDEDCMLGTMEEVEANTNSGYVADALVVSSLKNNFANSLDMLNNGLGSVKSMAIDSNTINSRVGNTYFSAGGVWIIYNEYFVLISVRLNLAIQLQPNAMYSFGVPASVPWTACYHEKITVTIGGKRIVLSLNNNNAFSIVAGEPVLASDYIREDLFCFRKH